MLGELGRVNDGCNQAQRLERFFEKHFTAL